jgi:multidrug resistance efflux pump
MSEKDFERQDSLVQTGVISVQDSQQTRAARDQVDQLATDLHPAKGERNRRCGAGSWQIVLFAVVALAIAVKRYKQTLD